MKFSLSFIKQIMLFRLMVVVLGLSLVGNINAKTSKTLPQPVRNRQSRQAEVTTRGSDDLLENNNKVIEVNLEGVPTPIPSAPPMSPETSPRGIPEDWIATLLQASVPWNPGVRDWVNYYWPQMSKEQKTRVTQDYNLRAGRQKAEPLRVSPVSLQEEQGWGDWASQTFGRVKQAPKALWGYGEAAAEKLKAAPQALWGYGEAAAEKVKAAPQALWSYGKETARGIKIRLFREIGKYKEELKAALQDRAAYPTTKIAIQALNDQSELDSPDSNVSKIVRDRAKKDLIQSYNTAYDQMNQAQKAFEDRVINQVNELRTEMRSDLSTVQGLRNYADRIEGEYDLAQYQAVLSEYYRALNKADILDKIQQKARLEEANRLRN